MFKVNNGNSKLGKNIMVINLPAISTCRPDAPCKKLCYANKGTFRFPAVKKCYGENLETFLNNPMQAELDILSQMPYIGFCRIHASGDFVNREYFDMIIRIANKLPNVKFMAYTKKYEMINDYIAEGGIIPSNLIVIFSLWDGFKCDNPYNMPTAIVRLKKGNIDAINDNAIECTGECSKCYKCWMLESNEQVVFNEH